MFEKNNTRGILKPLKGKEEGDACGTMMVSWPDWNKSCISHFSFFFFLFPHLKHILTARVPLGSQLPKVEKIKMSDVKRHITQKSYRTTLKCSEISRGELEFWGLCDILKIKLSVCTMLLRQKIMERAQRIM